MTVVFLCDGNPSVGLGHTSRCLGLAEALRRRGFGCLFTGEFDERASGLVHHAGFDIANKSEVGAAEAVVVDSYEATDASLESLANALFPRPLVIIDDFARLSRYPDRSLIVNFTVRAAEFEYRGEDCTVLKGPRYFLAREAIGARYGRRPSSPPRRVLVAIGGFDKLELAPVVESILLTAGVEVERVSGGTRPDLAEEYARADACITSGGLTKYEAAYLGLPLAAISQTTGEAEDTERFARLGLCVDLGSDRRPAELAPRILAFLHDLRAHARMQMACTEAFRQDSTAAVAAEVESSILSSKCRSGMRR